MIDSEYGFHNENDYKIKPEYQFLNTGLIRQHWNDPHMRNNPSNNLKPTHFLSGFIPPHI